MPMIMALPAAPGRVAGALAGALREALAPAIAEGNGRRAREEIDAEREGQADRDGADDIGLRIGAQSVAKSRWVSIWPRAIGGALCE